MSRPTDNLMDCAFTRWTVISYVKSRKGDAIWLCRCDCGQEKEVAALLLKSGNSKSCGCLQKELVTARNKTILVKHGRSISPEYVTWKSMRSRCFSASNPSYPDYGGRGIGIEARWAGKHGFENFFADMGLRPNGTSLDRIDVNGHYGPLNCRWATPAKQAQNRRKYGTIEKFSDKEIIAEAKRRNLWPN